MTQREDVASRVDLGGHALACLDPWARAALFAGYRARRTDERTDDGPGIRRADAPARRLWQGAVPPFPERRCLARAARPPSEPPHP